VHGHRAPLEPELPGVDRVDPADALDESGLAGPVVPDQRGDLTGVRREVDTPQDGTAPKLL